MTFILINQDNTFEVRPGVPDADTLIRLVGDGIPELVRTGHRGIVMWVNDNYIAEQAAGTVDRNILATVVAVGLDAPLDVYAGPVVITALDDNPLDGYGPAELDPVDELALAALIADTRTVIDGGEVEGMAADVAAAMRDLAGKARTQPMARPTAVYAMSVEDFLHMLGER